MDIESNRIEIHIYKFKHKSNPESSIKFVNEEAGQRIIA